MDMNGTAADLYPNTDDQCAAESRFAQIKTKRCVVRDGIIAISYRIAFADASGNHCDMSAYKSKSTNETSYTLHRARDAKMRGLLEEKVIALLQNDFRVQVSTLYYSEDVLYEPPWKVEHSFCIEGHKFKIVIVLDDNYFFLEADSDSTIEAFSDRLAVYIKMVMMEIENSSKE